MEAAKKAKELAKHGRYGDTELLHVNKAELAGLASLAPGGRLPINPVTGLPEAFFFLPFLLGAAAAPAAAAAIPAAATAAMAAPAAAAGLGAAALPAITATGALDAGAAGLGAGLASAGGAGIGALSSGLNAGISAASQALPAAASPVAQAATQAAAQGAGSIAPQVTQAAHGLSAANTASKIPSALDPLKGFVAPPPTSSMTGFAQTPLKPNVIPLQGDAARQAMSVNNIAGSQFGKGALGLDTSAFPEAPKAGGLGGLLGGMDMNQMILPAMMLSQLGGGKGGGSKEEKSGPVPDHYTGPDAVFPGSDYQGGIDPEWNYFPRGYAAGGLVDQPQAPGQPMQATIIPNQQQGGGLQSLMNPPMMQAPKAQMDSPYKNGGGGKPSPQEEQLIMLTAEAIKGTMPNGQAIIQQFLQTFGPQALQDLIARVKGGGQGDGQSDSIPAMVDGKQPAALSSGEHVVPSDVVSHLGNGDNQAGSQRLQEMQNRIRMMRGAPPQQPPAIDPNSVMPG